MNAVSEKMTEPWAETMLPTIFSRYPLKDIFHAKEFGLFYQCLPDRSYHLKGEKCSGGKHSKTRLTGLAVGNPFGERLPMFVIWKSKKPFKKIVGESNAVSEEMTAPWAETALPTILSRYPLKDVFNANEFGSFYQCLPDRSYHLKGEKCSGGKHSKTRLTGLAAGNPFDERLPMFVIRKSKMPRCFKGVKHLPCRYRNQAKSWMSSELFEEWVRELDRKFGAEKRNIAMIMDNCKAHQHLENLGWVELIFLPLNTTSVTQPMGQGIIRSLEAKYQPLAYLLWKKKRPYRSFLFSPQCLCCERHGMPFHIQR